ncbi:CopG family transcriptional regulator [Aeromonas veronii]|uniref:CopG family transcriptional regulator n=1 Tax=Aeromonas veronii TaxID=654 RepID=A0A3A9I5T5_AERVE|nr:type II toxin-antitoxin system HicB family antitoxin [Aeromonas veronii]RKJ83788.1 CopG family transcriptional regulator [Aeromonas veronii]
MLFSVGVELPAQDGEAFGLVVPALCSAGFGCFSAADSEKEIPSMVTEAITMVLEEWRDQGHSLDAISDLGVMRYRADPEYAFCCAWLMLDVDVSAFEGRPKRINVSLPDTLIQHIDNRVSASHGQYRDRSHFLAVSARHELQSSR